jgi:hypothetical protein
MRNERAQHLLAALMLFAPIPPRGFLTAASHQMQQGPVVTLQCTNSLRELGAGLQAGKVNCHGRWRREPPARAAIVRECWQMDSGSEGFKHEEGTETNKPVQMHGACSTSNHSLRRGTAWGQGAVSAEVGTALVLWHGHQSPHPVNILILYLLSVLQSAQAAQPDSIVAGAA